MVLTYDCVDDDGEQKAIRVSLVVIKYLRSVWEGSRAP